MQSVGQAKRSTSPGSQEQGQTGKRSRRRARTAECPCCQPPQPPQPAGGPFPCGHCQRCGTSSSSCSQPGPWHSNRLTLSKGTTAQPQPTGSIAPGRPAQPHKPLQTQRAQLNPSTPNETLSCPNETQFIQGGIGAPKLGLVVLIKFQIGWRDRRKTFEGSETRKIRLTGMIKLQMCPNLKRQKFS